MREGIVPASGKEREKFSHELENQNGGEDPFLVMYWAHESYRNGEEPTLVSNSR
jgi:hypothetical protein